MFTVHLLSLSLTYHGCDGFGQADLLVFEVVDRVVVLQELSAEDPVLFAWLAAHTHEVPWLDQQEVVGWILHATLDVGVVRHSDVARLALLIQDHVEFNVGHDWSIWVTFASPDWLSLLAVQAVVVKVFDQCNEGIFRNHGQAHTIVEDDLLHILGELLSIVVDAFCVHSPIELVLGLVHPGDRCILLGKFLEIIATEGNVTRTMVVV